jgi:hypothetical protein
MDEAPRILIEAPSGPRGWRFYFAAIYLVLCWILLLLAVFILPIEISRHPFALLALFERYRIPYFVLLPVWMALGVWAAKQTAPRRRAKPAPKRTYPLGL